MNREALREELADILYDDSCADPDCATCEATLDALTDRVLLLLS